MNRIIQIVIIISLIIFINGYSLRETFRTQDASGIPSKMLLSDWYPEHKPMTVSNMEFSNQWVNYPIFPAHSTNINNIRQWYKPNNGLCVDPELCGNVYNDLKLTIPQQPKLPGFDNGIRVNYYNTDND